MPNARDVILKHIDAFNGRDSDADPWAADAEMTAPGAQVSGRDNVIGFMQDNLTKMNISVADSAKMLRTTIVGKQDGDKDSVAGRSVYGA